MQFIWLFWYKNASVHARIYLSLLCVLIAMKVPVKPILLALLLVAADQITKAVTEGKSYMLGSVGIDYVVNRGAAFGVMQGWNWLLIGVSFAVIGWIAIYYHKEKSRLMRYALVFIFSGTFGNLIDRLSLGYVRDFIAIGAWPNFNIADSLNVIGVALVMLTLIRREMK